MMAKAGIASELSTRAWQRMLSGRRLDLLNPSPLDIEIGDIAHGLARVARCFPAQCSWQKQVTKWSLTMPVACMKA